MQTKAKTKKKKYFKRHFLKKGVTKDTRHIGNSKGFEVLCSQLQIKTKTSYLLYWATLGITTH